MSYELLYKNITESKYISESNKFTLSNTCVTKYYKKGEILQQDGKIAHKQWFVCNGFIASYFNYHHLKHTCLFVSNRSFIQSPKGFETHQKARETIVAQIDLHTLFTTYEISNPHTAFSFLFTFDFLFFIFNQERPK